MLLKQACELILKNNAVSTGTLRRKLNLTVIEVAALLQELETNGFIGSFLGSGQREVHLDKIKKHLGK